jgi:hypothetical protein
MAQQGRGDQVHARIELDRAYLHSMRDGRLPDVPRHEELAEHRPGSQGVGAVLESV